jgi:hypothetical protein
MFSDVVVEHSNQQFTRKLPPTLVKAVDLSAEISFIAFTIGVQVDLEAVKLPQEKNVRENQRGNGRSIKAGNSMVEDDDKGRRRGQADA